MASDRAVPFPGGDLVPADLIDEMRAERCAHCNAAPGEPCRTSTGKRANWHALRLYAAGRTRNAGRGLNEYWDHDGR